MKEFKYFSFKSGCYCSYKMPDDEFENFNEKFSTLSEEMKSQLPTVEDFIIACLAINN